MGFRMDSLHAPTVSSGPTSEATANGTAEKKSFPELIALKDNIEAELSALSSVLDSVCPPIPGKRYVQQHELTEACSMALT